MLDRRDHSPPQTPESTLLRAFLDSAVDGIVTIGENGRIDAFNAAAERMFGFRADEVVGRDVAMLMPEPHASEHQRYLERYLAGGEGKVIGIGREVEGQRKDGSLFPIELSVGHAHVDGRAVFVGIVRDITERKHTEELVHDQHELIRVAFDRAPLPTITMALDGRILRSNRVACEKLRYSGEALAALRVTDLLVPEDLERFDSVLAQMRDGDVETQVDHRRYRRSDGAVIHGRTYLSVVRGEGGAAKMVVLQFEDQTERILGQQLIDSLREELAHVGRIGTVGEMATGIAHEINQPLTAISNYAQACRFMIERDALDSDRLLGVLGKISDSAKHAGAVISRLRQFLRKRESVRERVDISELVRSVASLIEADARFRDAAVELDLPPGGLAVEVDRIQIQQVLVNLLLNGLDSMAHEKDRSIRVKVEPLDDDQVLVSVRDYGSGIPPGAKERVFDSFFTTKEEGMGVGLGISKSIVDSHGGRIWFAGNPDRGTTFHFTLPTAVEPGEDSRGGHAQQS